MFAEDIGPWLEGAALFFGGIAAAVLALAALVPAWRGHRQLAIGLIAPAILMVLLTTCWLAKAYFARETHDREEIMDNYVQPWFFMAFLPLIASFVAFLVLYFKRKKQT